MEYELVHEIKNLCPNNQMRDIFIREIACEDPEVWLRATLAGKAFQLTVEPGSNGAVTIHAVVDGMVERYLFTPME